MNLWILSSEVASTKAGGIARYVDNFARLFAAAGHKVLVIAHGEEELEREVVPGYREFLFVPRHRYLNQPAESQNPTEHPAYPYQIMDYRSAMAYQYAEVVRKRVESEGPPDIIECQDYNAIGYFVLQEKLVNPGYLAKTPILAHLHTPDFLTALWNREPRYGIPGYWIGRMERAFILGADARLCPSRYLVPVLREAMEEPDLAVTSIPLPSGDYPEVAKGDEGESPDPELVYFGRLEPRKGVGEWLAACEQCWRVGLRFRVRLIGGSVYFHPTGEPYGDLLRRRYRHRIESGELLLEETLPHEDVLRRVGNATAVVIPSLVENFPNTCLEAMALGKTVLASKQGGQAEMIGADVRCGLLFDWEQEGSCESALQRVLALDSNTRHEIGMRARDRIQQLCDPERILELRVRHFQEVIAATTTRTLFPFPNRELRSGPMASRVNTPRVSAIIPHYNLGAYVGETIDSLRSSAQPPDEILLIDDGSTDPDSLAKLESLEREEIPTLRILRKPNEGLSRTRNYGAEQASGDFLLFVDADDCVEPGFLGKATSVLQQYRNVHYVSGWARFFDQNHGMWISWNTDLPYLLAHNLLIPVCMVRRSSFLAYGRNKAKIEYGLEDYEGWISMAEAGCGGVSIPQPMVRYRVRGNSMFQVMNKPQMLYLFDLISREHPGLYARYGRELFNLLNANGPAFLWNMPCAWQPPLDEALLHASREAEKVRVERDAIWHEKERFHEELLRVRAQLDALSATKIPESGKSTL